MKQKKTKEKHEKTFYVYIPMAKNNFWEIVYKKGFKDLVNNENKN